MIPFIYPPSDPDLGIEPLPSLTPEQQAAQDALTDADAREYGLCGSEAAEYEELERQISALRQKIGEIRKRRFSSHLTPTHEAMMKAAVWRDEDFAMLEEPQVEPLDPASFAQVFRVTRIQHG